MGTEKEISCAQLGILVEDGCPHFSQLSDEMERLGRTGDI